MDVDTESPVELTKGIVKRLFEAREGDDELFDSKPTVQVLSVKKVDTSNATKSGPDRYRLIISDGEHFLQSMLATQLNPLVEDGVVTKCSIVTLDRMNCNFVPGKHLIIVLAMSLVRQCDQKIGNASNIHKLVDQGALSPAPQAPSAASSSDVTPAVTPAAQQTRVPQPQQSRVGGNKASSIYPIEGLSPYSNNWTIKVRVTQKSDIKTWANSRGEGKLFSVTLMDESGEIKGTGFNAVVDELYDKLQEGNVYYISKARVNLAKKKFSNVANDYELTFEKNTGVEECPDTSNVPAVKYNFAHLAQLEEVAKDSTCDVIGVVQACSDVSEITSKATNKTILKRELTLVDQSGKSVKLTLWGAQAQQYNHQNEPIIAFRGVKVGDFGGRSLSMYSSSTMSVNPDLAEAHALRGWYDGVGSNKAFAPMTSSISTSTPAALNLEDVHTLLDVRASGLGQGDRVDNFSCRAMVMHIKENNLAYPACPTEGCNKKVIDQGDGTWRCEKCDRSFEKPQYRYILTMAVADHTTQGWLTGFNDVGQTVFGASADELIELKENDDDLYKAKLNSAVCKTYNFSCRAKQDTFNDTTRVRYNVQRILPLDHHAEGCHLRDVLLNTQWGRL